MRALFALLGVVAIGLGAASRAGAADPRPDLVLRGTVTGKDLHTYLEAPFEVPAGVDRLTVHFSQDGAVQRTVIDLGLFDPQRFRGWSGGARTDFTLAETDATPAYLPGVLPSGRWRLILGVPFIRPGVTTRYQAEITFGHTGDGGPGSSFADKPLRDGPGWYRGDLHSHTAHSDGKCLSRAGVWVGCPAFLTLEAADRRGLDFLVVSDHNTDSHFDVLRELQPYFDRTLIIPGRELTTFEGHANALGAMGFIDFRLDGRHVRTADDMIAAVHRAGGLFSINHPGLPSGMACMGCGWTAPVAEPAAIDAVEVVNGATHRPADGPETGFAFWQGLLDKGLHPTAVGGSDNHNAQLPPAYGLGAPTTVVFATSLSQPAILAGIKAGHVFIDLEGTRDRQLDMRLTAGSATATMGDHIALPNGEPSVVHVHVVGAAGGRVQPVSDAGLTLKPDDGAPLGADEERSWPLAGDGRRHWLYVKVYDAKGALILVGNPIYITPG